MVDKELETRKCVLTGEIRNKNELLRFAVLEDGTLIPDFNKKIEGRGVYVSNSKKLLEEMTVKNKPLNKVLHKNVVINRDLPQVVENILAQAGLNYINMARKIGELYLGFDQVKEAVKNERVAFIVEAIDAGKDGKHKIESMADETEKFTLYDIKTLSEALNRENTVYLAVKKGKINKSVALALQRYQTYLKS